MQLIKSLFLLNLFAFGIYCDKFQVLTTKIECGKSDPEVCLNMTCSIKPISRGKTLLNLGCEIPKPLHHAFIKYQLNFKYNVYKPYLINFDEDLCAVMESRVNALAIKRIAAPIKNYTNIFQPCPYEGHIYIKDFVINEDIGHPAMPMGDYRSDIRFYNKENKTLLAAKVFLTFKPIGKNYQTNG